MAWPISGLCTCCSALPPPHLASSWAWPSGPGLGVTSCNETSPSGAPLCSLSTLSTVALMVFYGNFMSGFSEPHECSSLSYAQPKGQHLGPNASLKILEEQTNEGRSMRGWCRSATLRLLCSSSRPSAMWLSALALTSGIHQGV